MMFKVATKIRIFFQVLKIVPEIVLSNALCIFQIPIIKALLKRAFFKLSKQYSTLGIMDSQNRAELKLFMFGTCMYIFLKALTDSNLSIWRFFREYLL